MTKRRFTVVFEHGDRPNQWVAFLKELPQCHTFGRGLRQTRARIREALALWAGDQVAKAAQLDEVLPIPPKAKRAIRALQKLRAMQESAMQVRDAAVAELQSEDWSMRDIGQILELSHQRVGQVARPKRRRSHRAAAASK